MRSSGSPIWRSSWLTPNRRPSRRRLASSAGCSAILWRDGGHAQEAAEALRLTAQDLLKLGVVDQVVSEPLGGAHRLPKEAVEQLGSAIDEALRPLLALDGPTLRSQRREKFLAIGQRGL